MKKQTIADKLKALKPGETLELTEKTYRGIYTLAKRAGVKVTTERGNGKFSVTRMEGE